MPIYISASLLTDYISCNRRAHFRLHHSAESVQSRESFIGTVVHESLEKYSDFPDLCRKHLTERLPEERDHIFGMGCIDTFYDKFHVLLGKDDAVEFRFKIPIRNDCYLVGKMDRISGGSVYDWKTERTMPKSINKSIQFSVYWWAYKRLFEAMPRGVYYASLTSGALLLYKPDELFVNSIFGSLVPEVVNSIRAGRYTPTGLFNGSCFRCQYKDICLKEMESELDSTTSDKK